MPEAVASKPKQSATSATLPATSEGKAGTTSGTQTPEKSPSASTASLATSTKRKPRSKVDPNEDGATKFRRLATHRVNQARNKLALVANLATYPHDEKQAERILTALDEAVAALRVRFTDRKRGKRESFSL